MQMYEHENTGPIKIEMANARSEAGIFCFKSEQEKESNEKLHSCQQGKQELRSSAKETAQLAHRDKHGVESTKPFCFVA